MCCNPTALQASRHDTDAAMTLILWGSVVPTRPYADSRGFVRWAWLWWRGVPMPLRVCLWALWGVRPWRLPGCGCLDGLKTAWERLAGGRQPRPA